MKVAKRRRSPRNRMRAPGHLDRDSKRMLRELIATAASLNNAGVLSNAALRAVRARGLRKYRGLLPVGFRFDRDETNTRSATPARTFATFADALLAMPNVGTDADFARFADTGMLRLNTEQFDRFTALALAPIAKNPNLQRLLEKPAPWEDA